MTEPTLSEILARATHYGYDEEGWHPALEQALDGVTPEVAAWKPAESRNSIHEIVRHLIHWKRAALDGFQALSSREAFEAYSARDWQRVPESADWSDDAAELRRVSLELLQTIESSSDSDLSTPPEGGRRPRLWNWLNMATHDAYHAGQIMYLRKLQEALD